MTNERRTAVALALALAMLVVVTTATADRGQTARPGLINRLSQPTLERAAHRAVLHGRILSTRWGDATPWMRNISRELVARAFTGSSREWALCVVGRESGFNPGAISSTDDHGLPQINRPSHSWVDYPRIVRDPVYAVAVMVRLSDHGSYRAPWGWSC